MMIANMASGMVAIQYGLKGPSTCTVTACAASAHAIGDAMKIIERGQADVMIAGGTEASITGLTIGGFEIMRATSTRNDEPQKASIRKEMALSLLKGQELWFSRKWRGPSRGVPRSMLKS